MYAPKVPGPVAAVLGGLLLLAGACTPTTLAGGGGDGGAEHDGGDEPAVDAGPPGQVTIRVLREGSRLPVEGASVYFVGPDGAAIATVLTDAEGVAQAEVPPGSTAVAMYGGESESAREAIAVVDVKPGDDISLGGEYSPIDSATGSMIFAFTDFGAGSYYVVQTPCGYFSNSTNVVTVLSYPGCDAPSFAAFASVVTGDTRRVQVLGGVEFESGGIVEVETLREPTREQVTLNGLPRQLSNVRGYYAAGRTGSESFLTYDLLNGENDGQMQSATFQVGAIESLDVAAFTLELYSEQSAVGTQRLSVLRDPDGEGFTLAVDELAMPWVGLPLWDPTSRTFGWVQTGDGEWDASYLSFNWYQNTDLGDAYGRWRIVAPPGRNRVTLPPLPEEFEAWLPDSLDGITPSVTLMESSHFADWDAARREGLEPLYTSTLATRGDVPTTLRLSVGPNGQCSRRGPGGAEAACVVAPARR